MRPQMPVNLLHFLLHILLRPLRYIVVGWVFPRIPIGQEARTPPYLLVRPYQQSAVDDQQHDNREAHEVSVQPDSGADAVFHRFLL